MRLISRIALLPLVLAVAAPLRSQQTTGVDNRADSTRAAARAILLAATNAPDSSARVGAAPAADRRVAAHYAPARQTGEFSTLARQHAGLGQPMAMMIVGGAAFLAGAIVGDTPGTIMMIGGAVIGLVGLYEYLQ